MRPGTSIAGAILSCLVLVGCSTYDVQKRAEAQVPQRFGVLAPIEAVYDLNCYAVVFRIAGFSDATAATHAPADGDVARRTRGYPQMPGSERYPVWASLPADLGDGMSIRARTHDAAFNCGGHLSSTYTLMLDHASDAAEYAFSADDDTMLVVDATKHVVLVMFAG